MLKTAVLADLVGHALDRAATAKLAAQALEIPLPRARQGLVEVVDVEDQPAFRGGEPAEVHQVAITAQLHREPSVRRRSQVGGHARRRSTEEAELRLRHPPVADRQSSATRLSPCATSTSTGSGRSARRLPVAVSAPAARPCASRDRLRCGRHDRSFRSCPPIPRRHRRHQMAGRARRRVSASTSCRPSSRRSWPLRVPHSSAAGGRFRAQVDAPVAPTQLRPSREDSHPPKRMMMDAANKPRGA